MLVQCKFQTVALKDTPTKFCFSLVKKQGQSKFMHGLKSTADVLLIADSESGGEQHIYADLYSSDYMKDEDSFNDFESFCGIHQRVG